MQEGGHVSVWRAGFWGALATRVPSHGSDYCSVPASRHHVGL